MSRQLGLIEPQLLTSVDQPPQGNEWSHEIKHDGCRTLLIVQSKQARAYTRTGLDWTDRYAGIVSATLKRDCRSAIIDGEVIVQDDRGLSAALGQARSMSPALRDAGLEQHGGKRLCYAGSLRSGAQSMIPSPIPVLGILSAILFPIFVMVTVSCAWNAFTSDDRDGGAVAVIAGIVAVVTAPNALMTYADLIWLAR